MSWCDTCTNEDGAECIGCRGWTRGIEDARPVGQYVHYRNSSGGFTTAGPFNDDEAREFRARIAGVTACPDCKGTGADDTTDPESIPCAVCNGTGKAPHGVQEVDRG